MKRIFISCLFSVFVFLFSSVLYLYNANITFFNKEFIKTRLLEEGVYQQLPSLGMDYFLESQDLSLKGLPLGETDLKDLAQSSIPPDWLQNQTERAIDQIFPYLLGQSDHFQIKISPQPLKKDLSFKLEKFLEEKLSKKKPCTENEVRNLALQPSLPDCRPPEEVLNQLFSDRFFTHLLEEIPDEIILSDQNFPEITDHLATPREVMRLIPVLINFSFGALVLTFIFLLLLFPKNLKSFTRWISTVLTSASITPLIFSFLVVNVIFGLLPQLLAKLSLPPLMNNFLLSFIKSILNQFFTNIQTQTLVIFLLGGLLFIVSFFLKSKTKSQPNPLSTSNQPPPLS
jgi:hypothetical protein